MKIVFNNAQKMNEIVFANRNKMYGAYVLRSSYNSTLIKSLGIVLTSILMFWIASVITSELLETKTDTYDGTNDSFKIVLFNKLPAEVIKPIEKPTEKMPSAKKSNILSTNILDSNYVEQNNLTLNNNIDPVGTSTGNVNSVSPFGTGTSTNSSITSTVQVTEIPTAFPAENPEFEGGNKALLDFIAKNMVYPGLARDANQQGTVYISFVINEVGVIESSKVLKGIGYGCDEESIRVINKIPKFKKPGRDTEGKPVKVIYNIPIAFKLK